MLAAYNSKGLNRLVFYHQHSDIMSENNPSPPPHTVALLSPLLPLPISEKQSKNYTGLFEAAHSTFNRYVRGFIFEL